MTVPLEWAAKTVLVASMIAAISPALACVVSVPMADSDTAEERTSTGYVYMTSSDLELTADGSTAQIVGIRFPGVGIPKGATIKAAYIQFEVDEVSSVATNLTIRAHAADNAPTFSTTAWDISKRPRTVAAVSWNPPAWTTLGGAGAAQRTPDIKGIVQEIVNRPGWASGNAIAMMIEGSGKRTAEPRAELIVEWSSSGSGVPPVTAPVEQTPQTTLTVQAEDFDRYYDTGSTNILGAYRRTGVDIKMSSDSDGSYAVGVMKTGEWLEYDVTVPAAGSYTFSARVASAETGSGFHLEADGLSVTGFMAVPYTGAWNTGWTTVTKTINLPAGIGALRIHVDAQHMDLNYFSLTPLTTTSSAP